MLPFCRERNLGQDIEKELKSGICMKLHFVFILDLHNFQDTIVSHC